VGLKLTVTLYVPALLALNELIVGFAELEVKLLGPVHEYVTVLGDEGLKFTDKFAVLPFEIHWLGVIVGTGKKPTTTSSVNVQPGP
jgi:hypothetical protein